MSLVAAALGGAAVGGAASIFGGAQANAASAKQAKLNRAFQERMTRNKHTYEVADLRAAGLNPILSAHAGAAVPTGSQAQQKDVVTPAITSALAASQISAQIKLIEANTALTTAKTDVVAPAAGVGSAAGKLVNKVTTYAIPEIDNIISDLKSVPSDRGTSAKDKSNLMRGLHRLQNIIYQQQNINRQEAQSFKNKYMPPK